MFWSHSSTVGPLFDGINSCKVTLEKQFPFKFRASAMNKNFNQWNSSKIMTEVASM